MSASREEIEVWVAKGSEKGATHVIIACDTFDYENYPVFVMPGQNVVEETARIRGKSMQRVNEVYDLARPVRLQLEEERAFHPNATRTAGLLR